MNVPSISTSPVHAIKSGLALLDRGAAELAGTGTMVADSGDSVDVRSGDSVGFDPAISGIRDLFLARLEIGAGAVLMHAYRDNRLNLFEMLRS